MDKKSLNTLEYNKIIDQLMGHAESSLGREKLGKLHPSTDLEEIERSLEEVSEALSLISAAGMPPLFGIRSIQTEIKRLQIGGTISAGGLLKIGDLLRCSRELKIYTSKAKEENQEGLNLNILDEKIESLASYKNIEDQIYRAIISEDEISDHASPNLKNIRRNIENKQSSIRDRLNSIIRSNEKYLQDSIYSVRDGRYVIPVKNGAQGNVAGLVHDTSASGQTIYIEPMAIVELNNDIRNLQIKEREEIEKILRELSALVAEKSYEISANEFILQDLDFIFAKAKYARVHNSTRPQLNGQGIIAIKKGRHPLLDDEEVVPVDIYIGEEFKTLVITGPNTGGKTVSLKLIGLLTAMTQSGLYIPADSFSKIGVFDDIYADIGDEQSIEQSLSTFSSHMVNIIDILEKVEDNNLVLFDELGAGTDPTEGSALAIAILEYLKTMDVRTIATTHYNELKMYALTEEGVENASMEFDVQSLSPTYRLLIGIPGKSNAFEISRRLGLTDQIIDQAKEYIDGEKIRFEDMVGEIDRDREIIEKERMEAQKSSQRAKRIKEDLEKDKERFDQRKEEILDQARREARDIIRQAQEESKLILDEMREISDTTSQDASRRIQEARDLLASSEKDLSKDIDDDILDIKTDQNPDTIKPGDQVSIPSLNQIGTVLDGPDSSGNVQVQIGIMKMNLPVDSVVVNRKKEKEENAMKAQTFRNQRIKTVSPQIDLRGKNVEEAMGTLDKYLDDAYLAGLKQVEIIHGKGSGALRQGLQPYFRKHKHIDSYRLGKFEEGGHGVTVVELK